MYKYMEKELSEKEKLGIDILKDLSVLSKIIETEHPITSGRTTNLISDISTKVKNLTLKF